MNTSTTLSKLRALLMAAIAAIAAAAMTPALAQDAAALKARHESLKQQLADNPFKRPLVLESTQSSGDLRGEVYAVVDQPFGVVAPALQSTGQWCELLILHLNVKGCSATGQAPSETLNLVVGRKFDQPLDDGYPIHFAYSVPAASPDYLRVQMSADSGPLSTRNYRLALEAVPLDDKHSFLHMSYAYAYGTAARLAMQAYLATTGRDKVGFSITGKGDDGKPVYVDGVRAVLERNTMRYYLAIETYLGSLAVPAGERTEKRLADWFSATERHAAQLHEIERDDYLAMKRKEIQRQRGGAVR